MLIVSAVIYVGISVVDWSERSCVSALLSQEVRTGVIFIGISNVWSVAIDLAGISCRPTSNFIVCHCGLV